ncbi:hypothetical protein GCM10011504_53530 [Siccirubricoccus deserti]|nr:hypothetical protein GCM10011504_53530 [Siccirubricoccus deserti]
MGRYVALDVSLKGISVCVTDGKGAADSARGIGNRRYLPLVVPCIEEGGSACGADGRAACQCRALDAANQVRPL